MYTNEEYCEMVLLNGQCNRNKRGGKTCSQTDSRRHASYCTMAVLFNACIKLEDVIDIFPCLVPHLQACGYPLRMF
ncbi:hypothetical protein TNCV_3626861 [Trichonephila clavipes]|nr:hypothetical protein TNCV_3626861 [Trichonephila clavipes]